MKILKNMFLLFMPLLFSCSADDPESGSKPETINGPPRDFSLTALSENQEDVSLDPVFKWSNAIDPNGDEVKYDLYLGIGNGELSVVASNLNKTEYRMEERLSHVTTYSWMVVAKDARGGVTESLRNQFKTRQIKLSEIIQSSGLEPLAHPSATIFNDKIWLSGGWHHQPGTPFRSDVFYSEDGSNWSTASDLPYPAVGHQLTVFDDKLWNIGGDDGSPIGIQNHVMTSTDGNSWGLKNLDESLPVLTGHSTLEWNGELLVLGGHDDLETYNRIWKSGDGNNWQVVAEDLDLLGYHSEAIIFKDTIRIIPGFSNPSTELYFYSTDAVTWEGRRSDHPLPYHLYRSLVVFNNKIWAIGGDSTSTGTGQFEIWYSDDAVNWFQAEFEGIDHLLYRHISIAFKDKIYVIGGSIIAPGQGLTNKIWVLE